ncbi:MAG TPA: hypothetical protein VF105_11860 [Gemmatimonadaceae bacterium]
MMDHDPSADPNRRRGHNSRVLIVIIVGMATVVALQYTTHPIFGPDKTATLWGMLTGLFIGGFLFGWLKRPWK